MALSATSSNTYSVLSTPPHPLSEPLPTDLFPFAKANQRIDELIQAMKNKTNVLDTSPPVDPVTTKKSPKLEFQTFRGKPLAMALYQPKRKRVARVPAQVESKKPKSRKLPTVPLARDAKGKFVPPMTMPLAPQTEVTSMETTRTPGTTSSSEQVRPMVTEPVVEAAAPTEIVLEVKSPYFTGLTFPMPTPHELASIIYSSFIIPKLSENKSFFLCCEQFFHQYYHAHLLSFFKSNIETTCVLFSQLDTLIKSALNLLGFD